MLGAGIMRWGLGEVEAWLGNIIMRLFSFLYIAASRMAHVHYFFLCIHFVSFHICITFLNMVPLIFFSLTVKNVRECCKAQ